MPNRENLSSVVGRTISAVKIEEGNAPVAVFYDKNGIAFMQVPTSMLFDGGGNEFNDDLYEF